MCIHVSTDHVHMVKILLFMSQFGELRKTRDAQRVCALEAINNNNNSCYPQWLIPLLLLSTCILRLSHQSVP